MKLTFEKLAVSNLMSIGSKPIEIDLSGQKKILITGKNGSGKSSVILEALTFCLFNKPFRPIKKGQLINSINKKKMLVELWFSDGKNGYHIKRGLKPNVFEVKKNGEILEESASIRDFQAYFETDVIKMSLPTFKQVIILGTAGYLPFMQLTAAQRRAMIEDILSLSVYSKMDQINKATLKTMKVQMDSLELKINGIRNEYEAHLSHIEKQKQMSGSFLVAMEETANRHKKAIDDINMEIAELGSKAAEIVMGIDYTDHLNKCSDGIMKVHGKISEVRTVVGKIDSSIAVINSQIGKEQKEIAFFEDHSDCPVCGQYIEDNHKKRIVDGTTDKINQLEVKKNGLQVKKGETDSAIDRCNQKIVSLEEVKAKYTDLMREFRDSQIAVQNINSEITRKKMDLQREQSSLLASEQKIESAKNMTEIDTTRSDELKVEMESLRDEKTDLFDDMYARKIVLSMLKDSGIKAVVMKRYMPTINKSINRYLKLLGSDCVFTLDQEFNEIIKSRGREEFSYSSFSQGEKARIDMALLFTWRDIASIVSGTEISLLVLDEVFDGAGDGEFISNTHKVLSELKCTSILISHREEHDTTMFNRMYRMEKKGRFSHLV